MARNDPHFLNFPYNNLANFDNLVGRIIRLLPAPPPPLPPLLPAHRASDYHRIVRVAGAADPIIYRQGTSNRSWVLEPINWPGGAVVDTTGGGAHPARRFFLRINFDFSADPAWPHHPTVANVQAYIALHGAPPINIINFAAIGHGLPGMGTFDPVNIQLIHLVNPAELRRIAHRIDFRTRKMVAEKVLSGNLPARHKGAAPDIARMIGAYGGRRTYRRRRRRRRKTRRKRRKRRKTKHRRRRRRRRSRKRRS